MLCVFEKIDVGWQCKNCDFIYNRNVAKPPYKKCDRYPDGLVDMPQDIVSNIYRYLHEREIWKKAGKPYRSDEEIERIFKVCEECEHFNKKSEQLGSCNICGCYLKSQSKSFNKIAWSTTFCPAVPPKWIAEVELEEEKNQEVEVEVQKQIEQQRQTEQKMFQNQENKQLNGLDMKEVAAHVNIQPPNKKPPCGCGH